MAEWVTIYLHHLNWSYYPRHDIFISPKLPISHRGWAARGTATTFSTLNQLFSNINHILLDVFPISRITTSLRHLEIRFFANNDPQRRSTERPSALLYSSVFSNVDHLNSFFSQAQLKEFFSAPHTRVHLRIGINVIVFTDLFPDSTS